MKKIIKKVQFYIARRKAHKKARKMFETANRYYKELY